MGMIYCPGGAERSTASCMSPATGSAVRFGIWNGQWERSWFVWCMCTCVCFQCWPVHSWAQLNAHSVASNVPQLAGLTTQWHGGLGLVESPVLGCFYASRSTAFTQRLGLITHKPSNPFCKHSRDAHFYNKCPCMGTQQSLPHAGQVCLSEIYLWVNLAWKALLYYDSFPLILL